MLSQEKRELLIRTYEETHDANLTAKIFCVNRSTVYARVKEYKKTGSTELHTNQRGRKRKITPEDDERIKTLINENNDITIREIKETLELDVSDEAIIAIQINRRIKGNDADECRARRRTKAYCRMSRTTTQPCTHRDVELVRIFVWFAIIQLIDGHFAYLAK